jgi:hypothetical protein
MIVGLMALCRFPYYEGCLLSLCNLVDKVYLRFDGITGNEKIREVAPYICGDKFGGMLVSSTVWNAFIWREELLRMLDDVKPELVLFPDEDEVFGLGIDDDLKRFIKSDKQQLAFNYQYPAPTIDGWKHKKPYPSKPHIKVYKWKPGLTYIPYKKRASLSNYGKFHYKMAKSKMVHYCFYTPELRKRKLWTGPAKKRWFRQEMKGKNDEQ